MSKFGEISKKKKGKKKTTALRTSLMALGIGPISTCEGMFLFGIF
jgi:hypothetical protein